MSTTECVVAIIIAIYFDAKLDGITKLLAAKVESAKAAAAAVTTTGGWHL